VSLPHEADWIRYAGVAIAFAGVLIATPDGVAEVGRRAGAAFGRMRDMLGHLLPFLKRDHHPHGEFGGTVRHDEWGATVTRVPHWEADAGDQRKIEILRREVVLLNAVISQFKAEVTDRFAAVSSAIQQSEARLRAAHGELADALEAKDRRAAQIDARGTVAHRLRHPAHRDTGRAS